MYDSIHASIAILVLLEYLETQIGVLVLGFLRRADYWLHTTEGRDFLAHGKFALSAKYVAVAVKKEDRKNQKYAKAS